MKSIVGFAFSSLSKFPVKLICCITFGSASSTFCLLKSLQLTYNFLWNKDKLVNNQLCNISLTYRNFLNVVICSQIIFYWPIKKVLSIDHNTIVFYFYFRKKYPVCLVRCAFFDKMITQKVYLLLENLDQFSNLNVYLVFMLIYFHLYLFQLIVYLNIDFNCCNNSALPRVDKVTTGT